MNAHDLNKAMLDAVAELEQAQDEHRHQVLRAAEADRAMRIAEASAYLAASGPVAERQAYVAKACAVERYAFKMADGLERSALEAIRSRRQILSALQSLAAAQREEAHLARYMDRELESA